MGQLMEPIAKKKCVIFDTNILVYDTYLLRTPLGASVLFYVTRGDMVIGLPEVIELEINKHFIKLGKDATKNIQQGYEKIEIIMGSRDDYHIPSEDELVQAVKQRLESLEHNFLRLPLTLEHSRGAFNRILDEVPPNAPKNQQYKDSCIWEAIVELSRKYDVYFVTADKGFYENREQKRGLDKQLKQEIEIIGTKVDIYESTDLFLNAIKQEVSGIDEDKLVEQLKCYLFHQLKSTDKTFEDMVFKDVKSSKVSLFLTEHTNIISVSFEVEIIADFFVSNNNVFEGSVKVEGECSYDLEAETISNLSVDSIEKYNTDGSKNVSKFIRGSVFMGRRVINYGFKSPLN